MVKRKISSLVDLCVNTAIDNLRYLGDVGGIYSYLLDRILTHCTINQLMHIEKCSEGSDLSPATNKLWKKYYEKQFGLVNAKLVVERMEKRNVSHKWIKLYEEEVDAAQNEAFDRIAQQYKEAEALKQSRQVCLCTKVPPSSKRSFFGGSGPGYNVSNVKSNIMKKAKIDFLKSNEVKNRATMKKNVVKSNNCQSPMMKPSAFSGKNVASTSKRINPVTKRF